MIPVCFGKIMDNLRNFCCNVIGFDALTRTITLLLTGGERR